MQLTAKNEALGAPLSLVVMGGSQIRNGAFLKGISFLAVQIVFLYFSVDLLIAIKGLITLGDVAQQRKGFDIIQGDNSVFMLVEGVVALLLVGLFAVTYRANVKDAKTLESKNISLKRQWVEFYEKNFAFLMLSPATVATLLFIILPIAITVLVAFTNYSAPNHIPPRNLVDWVGFKNFIALFELDIWSGTFFGVATWTVIWAVCATALTFGFGFILALAVENRDIKFKKVWRLIFILPYAIPAFVSLLVFRLLLNGVGPVNNMIGQLGFDPIAFLSDPITSKITVIFVSVWAGAPYFMLMISSALTNIPSDLYEAAEVDGASKLQQFWEITLPMVLHQLAPSLVMTFAHNFNNFGAIYLLTEGGPINPDYRFAGHTDILITWIYKLTLDFQQYHIAAVVSIVIFLFLSVFAIWQFRRMKSFKEDVGM
ncbi:sugar ABC transporter permease [Vibrio owensii 47666-1]|nr:sugar ABC transporter permease [Vibrio owensii]KIF46292.1 sugar ABC transporter permease [Vibrio owensii 47666-1]